MAITLNGTTGLAGNVTGNVTGSVTGNVTGNVTGALTTGGSLTLSTAKPSTSGTSVDFTGIPSWAKRITLMMNGVSTNGTSFYQIQIGSSGTPKTTGYLGSRTNTDATSSATVLLSSGFVLAHGALNTTLMFGALTITQVDGFLYMATGMFSQSAAAQSCFVSGINNLSAALDIVRLTTVNTTDTFDAGSVNIMYEG